MLALTHHFIIQFCAIEVGLKCWFEDYVVLGDDVIILNKEVAFRYKMVMKQLDVGISPTKSVQSSTGFFEFAKKFGGVEEDLSPLPVKAFMAARHSVSVAYEVFRSTGPYRLCDVLRFLGFGYRVRSSA